MSGLIAHTGPTDTAPVLLEGLRRLVHHGHDSAGIALLWPGRLERWRALAPLSSLERRLPPGLDARCGIAHTRLATNGPPSERNAHPHLGGEGRIALVHNGIVENADALRERLRADGVRFDSETDSEVLAQLLARRVERFAETLEEAVRASLGDVQGTCGLAALDLRAPGSVVVASVGSPLHVGHGEAGGFAASDAAALYGTGHCREIVTLREGQVAVLTPTGFRIGTIGASSPLHGDPAAPSSPDLHAEIHEQPAAIERAIAGRLDRRFASVRLGGLNLEPARLRGFRRVHLLGAGSSWHAALAGARMIESLARLPAVAEPAGDFLYREPIVEPDTLYLVASRSGETFDTLAAVHEIRARGGTVLGLVNDVGSRIAREVDGGVYLRAGTERAVAASKTVGAMLSVFALLALHFGRSRDVSPQRGARLIEGFEALPAQLETLLANEAHIETLGTALASASSVLFTGRGVGHALALEGARKLVEVAAPHADACSTAELPHGPAARLGPDRPCVMIMCGTERSVPTRLALESVRDRGAPLILIGATEGLSAPEGAHRIALPPGEPLLQPVLANVALQLLAWHAGRSPERGPDPANGLSGRVTGA